MRRNDCLRRVTVLVSSSSGFVDDLPAITGCPFFYGPYSKDETGRMMKFISSWRALRSD